MTGLVVLMSILDMNTAGVYRPATIVINNFLLPGAIALFFYGLIRENTFVQTMLSSKIPVMLGKASYTFYLIHAGIIYSLINHLFPGEYLLSFLLLNLIALTLWHTLEEPLNSIIRSL
jgi:peptidoglycan/LPS O-acetylase OafA/YrhL